MTIVAGWGGGGGGGGDKVSGVVAGVGLTSRQREGERGREREVSRGVQSWSISWGEGGRLANSGEGKGMERRRGRQARGLGGWRHFGQSGGGAERPGWEDSMQRSKRDDGR